MAKIKAKNPFTDSEMRMMFEKQRDKVPFEIRKYGQTEDRRYYEFCVDGRYISENVQDIWNDDYIIGFQSNYSAPDTKGYKSGHGYGNKRIPNFEQFRQEIFDAFNLIEVDEQLSLF